eukprot:TRINITY_DN8006_c0_g1_i1.p1 TRINITY_DN8006_c0_g1~~TRINITY_DN8006_c0_g1_i1.p1  ORF type:complete len:129 (-),score=21.26 TRINITY_DN8006_c0_g1_i1:62-448(-)
MSWQGYVDSSLVGTGHVKFGAIFGIEDKTLWAYSSELELITQAEMSNIIAAFKNLDALRSNGCFLASQKYLVLQGDESNIFLKKGAGGGTIVKTNLCVIIAIYGEGQAPGQCNTAAGKLADYLIENGY